MRGRLWVGLLWVGLAGCGGDSDTVPVEGTVTFNGKPLTTGTVIFRPDATRGNPLRDEPRGQLDEGGAYRLKHQGREGVPPGWYKVGVSAQRKKDPKDPYSYVPVVPMKFANPETSGLAVEVVASRGAGGYDIAVPAK